MLPGGSLGDTMGAIVFFALVTSPLWMLYIVIATAQSKTREAALWMAIAAVGASWILVEYWSSDAAFRMSRVFHTAPAAISLLMGGMALHLAKRNAKSGSAQSSEIK